MGVHYDRGSIGRIKEHGCRPCTIDIGGGIMFQGGVSQSRQLQLMGLMGELQREWDAIQARSNPVSAPSTPASAPNPTPQPSVNGTAPAPAPAPASNPPASQTAHAKQKSATPK